MQGGQGCGGRAVALAAASERQGQGRVGGRCCQQLHSCQSEGKGRPTEEKLERKPKIMRAYSSWVNVGERYNNNNNGGKKL